VIEKRESLSFFPSSMRQDRNGIDNLSSRVVFFFFVDPAEKEKQHHSNRRTDEGGPQPQKPNDHAPPVAVVVAAAVSPPSRFRDRQPHSAHDVVPRPCAAGPSASSTKGARRAQPALVPLPRVVDARPGSGPKQFRRGAARRQLQRQLHPAKRYRNAVWREFFPHQ